VVGVRLFVDGKFVAKLGDGNCFTVKKAQKNTVFLRKKDFNFFNRLNLKFNG
jgi:NAD kinase